MTEPNVPLLRKVVEWVEAEAEKPLIDSEWHQASWHLNEAQKSIVLASDRYEDFKDVQRAVSAHCGTAACAAGYVAQMFDERYTDYNYVDGVFVADFAAEKLGIPKYVPFSEREHMFKAHNSAADIRRIAEGYAGERL